MTTFATIHDALAALPVGAEKIADHLLEMGVRGSCRQPGACAVAAYLNATVDIPAGYELSVGVVSAAFTAVNDPIHNRIAPTYFAVWPGSMKRPDITEFIGNFDRGQYPALVAGTFAAPAVTM